jgi:hypothetical protein
MAAPTPAGPPTPESDPIADARALVAMAIGLGKRVRTVQHLDQSTDRKAGLYVSTLVRQASRLLQSTSAHDVPRIQAGANGPGGSAVHFVIRHDRLVGPPIASRFLVVGSDARLRCCVASETGGARVWADYDVSTAPEDLPLRAVLDSLSTLIARLESTVTQLEIRQITREAELDADIAISKARIAGLPDQPVRPVGVRRDVKSEEPVRPWTRHVAGAPRAAPPTSPPVPAREQASVPAAATPTPAPTPAPAPAPTPAPAVSNADDIFVAAPLPVPPQAVAQPERVPETPVPAASPATTAPEEAPPARRGFRLSRLDQAI